MLNVGPVLRNLGSGAAARLVSALFGLLLVVTMARIWRPEAFGEYVIGFNYFQLLQQTPLLGLHYLLARDVAREQVDSRGGRAIEREMATAAALGLGVAIATAATLWATAAAVSPSAARDLLPLVGLALLPTSVIMVIEMVLTGQQRLWLVAVVNISESLLRCVVFAVMIGAGAGARAVFVAFVVLRCAALAAYLFDRDARRMVAPHAIALVALRGHLRQAPVLFAILLLAAGFSRLDLTVLSWLAAPAEVAVYSVAARFYDLSLMVPSILVTALLPILARLHAAGSDGRFMPLLVRYGLLLGLPCAALGGCLAETVLTVLFGGGFASAAWPLRILLFATVTMALNQVMACLLLVCNLQRLDLSCVAVGCAVLVGLLLVLIPPFGITGAAVAALLGAVAQCLARAVAVWRWTGITVRPADVLGPALALLALLLVLWLGRSTPLLAAPVALLAFCGTAWALGSVRGRDLRETRALVVGAPG